MPGTPPTSPRLALPRYDNTDAADFATDVNALVDRLDAVTGTLVDTYANIPTASATLNGLRFFASDKAMEWQCVAGAWVLINVFAPEVSNLPAGPIDQQECVYLADATNGLKFHLRYRAASTAAYKWEVIGGRPLQASVLTVETVSWNAGWTNAATVGPTVIVPLAGDYDIAFAGEGTNGTGGFVGMSFAVGATAASDNDRILAGPGGTHGLSRADVRKTGVAAGASVTAKYIADIANATVAYRRISAMPVRVG